MLSSSSSDMMRSRAGWSRPSRGTPRCSARDMGWTSRSRDPSALHSPPALRQNSSPSGAKHSPTSSSTPTRARRGFTSRPARGALSSRFATTDPVSTPVPATPVTSASSRCTAARPSSAGCLRSRARLEPVPSSGWKRGLTRKEPRTAPEPADRIRVLLVDDHAVVRRGLLPFLDSEPDLEVVAEAEGGAQALELLARLASEGRRPHVVVMDLQMEPLDGIESTRQIRSRYSEVEVVALTSFGEEERVHAALDAGASGFLLKDSDADEVSAAIRAAHRGELPLDPAIARGLTSSLRAESGDGPDAGLTTRELEILRLLGAGKSNKEIAADLQISERTARTHVSNILGKLHLNSRTQAALWAVRQGLVEVRAE